MNITGHIVLTVGSIFLGTCTTCCQSKVIEAEPYQKPDESFYDQSQLSGIKDYAAFQQGRNVIILSDAGSTRYVIYADAKASPAERYAANTLADHLGQITKSEFKIVNARPENKQPVIAVGPDAVKNISPSLLPDFSALGHDGIVMRTQDGNLVLTGAAGSRRGTVYAVMTFLENIGCRWWTDAEVSVPQKPTLKIPEYTVQYRPALEYRDLHTYFLDNFAVYNKLNGVMYKIPEERGGKVEYKGPFFTHNLGCIVTAKEFAVTHPEWFAEINGKRQFGKWDGKSAGHVNDSQLCLSSRNADLLAFVIGRVKGYLKDAPADSIVSLGQSDGMGKCECADCVAVEKEEGSAAGSIVRFANLVASAIEKDFPQAQVEMLAYAYGVKPPVTKPRPNVLVQYAPLASQHLAPLDSKANESAYAYFIGWCKLTSNIVIWNYNVDFKNYYNQFPSLFVNCSNIRIFVKNGVRRMLFLGPFTSNGGDMYDLKYWVLSKVLWDQLYDEKALIREFVTGYYGEGSPYISRYIELLYAGDPMAKEYSSFAFLDKAYSLYLAGQTALKNDDLSRRRLERVFMPVLNAIMVNWPLLKQECGEKQWPFPNTPGAIVDDFIRISTENKINFINEVRETPAQWTEPFRTPKRIGKAAEEFKHIAAENKIEIQDDMFRLWHKGEAVFVVADEKASDGHAASMPATHINWSVQADLISRPIYEGGSGRWKVYAAIKIIKKGTGTGGDAFSSGVYDAIAGKLIANFTLSLGNVTNEEYHFYLIGSFAPTGGQYVYVEPAKNSDVESVVVDRFMLIREE